MAARVAAGAIAALAIAAVARAQTPGGASWNPNIGLVLTGYYAQFSKERPFSLPGFALGEETGLGGSGFNLGESEITVYGNIDPYLYGSVNFSFAPEGGAGVEEAFLQTTALPAGFSLKFGRFFSGIGYVNGVHRHADDFFEPPLPYQALLGGQFGDDGVQARWVAPTNFLLEIGLERFRGASFPSGGAGDKGNGADAGFVKAGGDLGESASWLAGFSRLNARADGRTTGDASAPETSFSGDSRVDIASLVWKWAPAGNSASSNLKLQAEVLRREERGTYTLDPSGASPTAVDFRGGNAGHQAGWYVQGRYQFLFRWRVALRQAEVKADAPKDPLAAGTLLDPAGRTPRLTSAMIEFDPSEFSQIRFQYSRDETQPGAAVNRWYLQYTITAGAHPAHTY
jgi:hypothetical protein